AAGPVGDEHATVAGVVRDSVRVVAGRRAREHTVRPLVDRQELPLVRRRRIDARDARNREHAVRAGSENRLDDGPLLARGVAIPRRGRWTQPLLQTSLSCDDSGNARSPSFYTLSTSRDLEVR